MSLQGKSNNASIDNDSPESIHHKMDRESSVGLRLQASWVPLPESGAVNEPTLVSTATNSAGGILFIGAVIGLTVGAEPVSRSPP